MIRPGLRGLREPARTAVEASGVVAAAGFGLASRMRGTKVFHPHGVVHEATVRLDGTGPGQFFGRSGEHPAVIRFSRAIGLPRRLPDIRGLALRLVDAHGEGRHQDFLLVTSGDGFLAQHLLLPTRRWTGLPYSSLSPYRIGEELYLVGARATAARGWRAVGELEQLAAVAAAGEPAFELCVARLGERLEHVGAIHLGPRQSPRANTLRFNPFNTGADLEPATVVNRLRDWAYPASQRGWEGRPDDALTLR